MRERVGDQFMRILPLIAVCLFMSAGFGHAQTEIGGKLKGLTQITLLVEDLPKDAQACGITPELVRNAFMYPASSSKLQIKDSIDVRTVFYIQITTLHERGTCFSNIALKLYIYQELKVSFADRIGSYEVDLWHRGWLGISAVNRHPQIIREQIENYTKQFLTAWNLDNKPQ
jgi:hypothetical protein